MYSFVNNCVCRRSRKNILNRVKRRKLRRTGQVLRHDSLIVDITEGRMVGKATRGRKRLKMLSDVTSMTYEDLKREAGDRSGRRNFSFGFSVKV